MTTSIAEYYLDELDSWKETMDFNTEKIDEMHEWLEEILRFDTVADLAGKVEHHLTEIFTCKQNMVDLRFKLLAFEKQIYKEQRPLSNELITEEMKVQQQELRTAMHHAEKTFMDVKYKCDDFLAKTIIAQNTKPRNNSLPK